MFKFGWRQDSKRHPRKLLSALRLKASQPNGAADLFPLAPAVIDQNECGSCVASCMSCALYVALPALGFVPSQRAIYAVARAIDRMSITPPGAPLTPLDDSGTEVLAAVMGVQSWGVVPTRAPMIGPRGVLVNSDCVPDNVNDEAAIIDLENGATSLRPGAYQINSVGLDRVNDLCLALDAGHPVAIGGIVDSTFQNYGPTSPVIGAQDALDPDAGGHALCVLSYRTTLNGARVFGIRNSWGDSLWGHGGNCEVNEAFIRQMQELFVITAEASC